MWGDGTPYSPWHPQSNINSYLFWLVLCHAFIDIGQDPFVSPLIPVQHPGAVVKDVALVPNVLVLDCPGAKHSLQEASITLPHLARLSGVAR